MRAETAAAYCDEPCVEAFLAKVAKGAYPQPARAKGFPAKWHKGKLDGAIARRHGLQVHEVVEDVSEVI
jgi:hypothetical protein